jgi:hypothetical protein
VGKDTSNYLFFQIITAKIFANLQNCCIFAGSNRFSVEEINRESGVNPEQSRCCESSFMTQTDKSLRLLGRRLLPDDKSEDLPMKTIAACRTLGIGGGGEDKR